MPARLSHLKPADYRVVPWKNGGGSTTEIAVDPPGSAVADSFRWRLSLAKVERSGPFSAFPGYDRTIMLVTGQGMVLDFAGHGSRRLQRPFEPLSFAGEWATNATLLGGASEDFNVMSDRARVRHRVSVVEPNRKAELEPAATVAIVCFMGAVEVRGLGTRTLKPRETLIAEAAGPLLVGGHGLVVAVALDSLSAAEIRP